MDLTCHHDGREVENLLMNECTFRWAREGNVRYLMMWFRVSRVDGVEEVFAVPVNPGGGYREAGGGLPRTWGLVKTDEGVWQVSPSINVLVTRELHPGEHPTEESIWHETPRVVSVPSPEPWTTPNP